MWTFIYKAASPRTSYLWAKTVQPWVAIACLLALAYGLWGGLVAAPADYQQGNVYRIMYIHVPAAIWSLGVYGVMALSAMIFLVWKIKLADVVAKVSAPIGASFTVLALVTGAIWGKPTWGTWWIWDARLTSELILLFIYFGIIGLRSAMPDAQSGARATAIMILVGLVNIPIIHYSVNWWHTLHQGSTVLIGAHANIAPSMQQPLLAMIAAFFLYYVWLVLLKVRCEWLQRESKTSWVKALVKES